MQPFEADLEFLKQNPEEGPISTIGLGEPKSFDRVMTPGRQLLIRALRRTKPNSVYALAKYLRRDRKNVTQDLKVLEDLDIVLFEIKTIRGRRCRVPRVPYRRVEVRISL